MSSKDKPTTSDPKFRKFVKELLLDDNLKDVCITFTKKDGSEREMFCTLIAGKIPSDKLPSSEKDTKVTDEVQRAFDVELQEWRSFRWDSVKSVTFSFGD